MKREITKALEDYDGKHTKPLQLAADRAPSSNDIESLIDVLDVNRKFQEAGTWLLKSWVDNGYKYSNSQIEKWFRKTQELTYWAATLHFCQALEKMPLPGYLSSEVFKFLELSTQNENKLVRAWSYNGLAILAKKDGSLVAKAKTLVARGQNDEAASVRARLRKIHL